MESMGLKSTIAVHGRYHAFRLGEGLTKAGVLDKIYTLYPRFKLPYDIPDSELKTNWFLGALKYANQRWGVKSWDNPITSLFDAWVAMVLKKPKTDHWIFTGYSGFSEKSLKKAKKMGAITLVERACPHIDEQEQLLREERSMLLKREISRVKNAVYEKMKREYDIADYIIVPSEYSKKSFVERGFSPDKVIITHLCNEKAVRCEPRKDENVFTVLCVGGHFYRKGLFYLLSAWKEIDLPNVRLILKGEVPAEFKYLLDIPNLEVISGHLDDSEMSDLYNRADIFVLPSIDEGFGMVVVEAMAAGLPVIVTENVGAADILTRGKEGFVVPIRDPQAIRERIEFFYKNRDKVKEMGENAYQLSKQYSPQRYAERVMDVYKKIIALRS